MADYEPVAYGRNAMELTPAGKSAAVYENVTMNQTPTVERQEEPRTKKSGPSHDTPVMKNKEGSGTIKVKAVVFCVTGMLTVVAVAATLGFFFVQISKQAVQLQVMQEQLMKKEIERNTTAQLIELLERELKHVKTRLNMSEATIKSLSTTCQSLDRNVTENNQKISSVETRVGENNRQVDMVQTRVIGIGASMRVMNSTLDQNQQKLTSINATVRMVDDIASGNQQKLSSINTTVQTTRSHLQDLNRTVLYSYLYGCPCSEYRYNPFSGSCYRVVKSNSNWTDSKDYCTASGEFLATFVTTESVNWLGYMRSIDAWSAGNRDFWVGGYKFPTGWKWTGRVTVPVDSSVWAPGQPNSYDCMENRISKLFRSYSCDYSQYFMCETRQISH